MNTTSKFMPSGKNLGYVVLAWLCAATIVPQLANAQSANTGWYLDASANLESDLVIYRASGSGEVSFAAVREGVRADYGFNNSIPNNWVFRDWDGSAWPSTQFSETQDSPDNLASAGAFVERSSETDIMPNYSNAFVGGAMNNAIGMNAATAFDFTLNVDANTLARIELFQALAEIEAINAAPGFGFAGVRIYDPTIDVNDPNGVNNPYDLDSIFLVDDGSTGQQLLDLDFEIDNLNNSEAISLDMRVEIFAVVFTSVPEPGSLLTLGALGCFVGLSRRRRPFRCGD